ncbi:MAG: ABC transporter ATP-binding protein [Rectinemataceae bacterium]|nr:ABC transporter ATP-binding protein [Rectinemataceae bacterium]
MKHLEVKDLRYEQGEFSLLASLELEQGRTGVILGPSGCGKTSLLRCIAGLERPAEGSITIGGRAIENLPPEKRDIGFIFQDLALFDHLTGRENIGFGLRLKKVPKTEADRATEALASKLRIISLLDRRPFAMSGGEKQRLAFARALATKPGLLLMDEPLSSLDAPLRRELRAYLRATLSQEGITALHVTHDVEEALELGDEIFLMKAGRILTRGKPRTIHENPPDAWCVRFLGLGVLLPVIALNRMADQDGLIAAETPFGRLGCIAASGTAISAEASRFFIPRGAATITSGGALEAGVNLLHADVVRAVFQGNFQRLVLRLKTAPNLDGPTGAPGQGIDAEDKSLFELEVDPSLNFSPGEGVKIAVQAEKCRILPELL